MELLKYISKEDNDMKKKLVVLMMTGLMGISVVACGGSPQETSTSGTKMEEASEPTEEPTEEPEDNKTEEVEVPEDTQTADVYFKDDVLKIEMATIKITGSEVAPPNTDFGEEKPTLIITYEFTNDSDELMQPGTAWIACFTATQETDVSVDDLDVALMPQDEKYAEMNEMSYTDIKPGATVEAVISYDINDPEKPVTLTATQGIAGEELGQKVFELK